MEYENYIKYLIYNEQIVGMNTCVMFEGIKINKAFGLKMKFAREDLASISTLYDVASLTKVLTVLPIICKLIDDKQISSDTKIKSILSEFKYDDVTIYDMLVHKSGLPSSVNMNDKVQNKESIVREIFKLDKSYNTGTNVVYSDIGYILFGLALEKMYGKPLDKISKSEVFDPLLMENTVFNPYNVNACAPTEYKNKNHTDVYQGVARDFKARIMDGVAGQAGLFSTASDIGNFMKMVLNNGYYNNKKYLSEEIIDIWYKTLVYEKNADRYRSLCWIRGNNKFTINEKNDNIIFFHGFAGPSISLDRQNNIGICLMSNSVHPLRENKDKLNAVRPIITDLIYDDYIDTKQSKVYIKKMK